MEELIKTPSFPVENYAFLMGLLENNDTREIMEGLIWFFAIDFQVWDWLFSRNTKLYNLKPIEAIQYGFFEEVEDVVNKLIMEDYQETKK